MTKSLFRLFSRTFAVFVTASSLFIVTPAGAQGDLLVAPTRVILDGRRGTEVILSNIGSEPATYRISLELRRMSDDGRLDQVEKTDANQKEEAALNMIRFAPRRITLPPGQPQAVRLAARPGGELPDGEYRAHLSFRGIPKARSVTDTAGPQQGVKIELIPIYSVTIPVIVRHGRVDAQVAINQPQVVAGPRGPELKFTMSRRGDSSTYGELVVTKPGMKEPVVFVRGIAIYPEVQEREIRIPVTPEQAAALSGQVRFEYREMPEAGGDVIAAVDTRLG